MLMKSNTLNKNIKLRHRPPSCLLITVISNGTTNTCNAYTTFTSGKYDISH